MKTKRVAVLSASLLALTAMPAIADPYNFSFTSFDSTYSASGTFETGAANGPGFNITSIAGSVTGIGGGAILGLIGGSSAFPNVFISPSGAFFFDNILFPNADPTLTGAGVLFTTGGGGEWNLWGNASNNYSLWKWDPSAGVQGAYAVQQSGTMTTVAAIPEPETYAMLLAGLGLLGFAARRRKLKAAAAA